MTLAEQREILAAVPSPLAWRQRSDGFVELLAHEGACPLYREGCTVYEVRPLNCRRYMCGREDGEPYQPGVVPMRVLATKRLRKQYLRSQSEAMETWGHAHGWTP